MSMKIINSSSVLLSETCKQFLAAVTPLKKRQVEEEQALKFMPRVDGALSRNI